MHKIWYLHSTVATKKYHYEGRGWAGVWIYSIPGPATTGMKESEDLIAFEWTVIFHGLHYGMNLVVAGNWRMKKKKKSNVPLRYYQ